MDKSKECRDVADEDSEDDDLLVEDELWELDTEDWAEEATKIFVQQCGECSDFKLTMGDITDYWILRYGRVPSSDFLLELLELWPHPGVLIPPVDPEDPDDEVPDEGDAGEEPPSDGDEPGGPGEDDPHNPPGGDDGGGNGGSTGGGGGDGGGSGGDGPRLNTCPTTDTRDPVSGSPVRLFAGDKIEEVIDLSVSLPGRDFQLKRFYNANLSLNTLGLVANGWNLDGFSTIRHPTKYKYDEELETWVSDGPDLDRLTVFNRNRHSKESFYRDVANTFTSEDYGPIYVSRTTRVWNSNEYPVWKLVIPGQSTIYYHREPEVGEEALATVSSLLYGALWQQVDPYKNTWIYEYDEEYFTERRLSTILLNGAGSATRAKIHFTWNSLDGEDIPPGAVWGVNGRLASVSVERLSGSEWHQTAFVSYQQNLERTGAGRIGDLVKVTYGMRVDRNHDRTDSSIEAWRRLIMLYRYHGTGTVIDEFETDEVMMTTGEGGQLKAVILPEQVEYLASLLVADGMNKGVALYRAAEALINADDGAPAWEGTSEILTPLDLAAKVIGYDNEGRVEVQYIQSGCGCAGVGHGMKETFEYISYGTSTYATTVLREYAIENDVYELYRTTYTDMKMIRATPYLENRVIESPPLVENGPVQRWVWHYEYLEARSHLLREYYPSAMSTYTPGSAVGPVLPSYTAHTTTGLVYEYAHDAQGRRTEVFIRDDAGVFQRVSRVTYSTDTALGRPDLMVKNERFRVAGSTDPEDIEVIEYQYGLYNSSDPTAGIAWMKTIYENELTSENGTGGTLYSATLYDSNGDEFWHKNADGSLTYRDHDSRSGIVDKLTHNASRSATVDNPALPSDFFGLDTDAWGRNSEGWSLTESGQLDMQGRVKSWTSVGGVTRYMLHEVAPLDTDTNGLGYYRVLSLPDEINAGVFTGPAMSTWQNAAGRVLLSNARLVTATSYTPLSYEFTLGTEVSRASAIYSLTGSRSAQRVWHDVAGNGSYETLFEYDAVGRVLSVTSPSGTVTYNASYDVFDRVLETKIGTSSTNAVTIAKYFYDHEMDGSNPVQGVGDGNLTLTRLYVDGTTQRDTIRRFDSRNRVEWVIPPLPPFEYFEYDNLDRMVARSIFSELPTGTPGDTEDDRGLYERTYYSQRGLVYKSTRTDQPQDISSTNANDVIGTWIWYDAAGRPIKQFSANSPVVKRKYDGHGRTVAMYFSDGGGDGGVGGSYSHATHVNSDEVIRRLTSNIEDPPLDVSEQEYNGLHWRVVSREDTDADGTLDEKRELVYSSSWQVLEEFVDEDYVSSPGTDRRVQQFWGLRHLDDAIMSREQDPVSGEIGRTSYKLTDRQFSVVAVVDVSGELMERVTYDPYGRAQHRWPADFNGDGYMDGTDTGSASLFTSIGDSGYRADEDLNRDGVTDIDDMVIAYLWGSKGPLPSGQISDPAGPGNRTGYAGYRFEPSSSLYQVRFRWYDTGLGRWVQRDPAGYVDGMGLYQYVRSAPATMIDMFGLCSREAQDKLQRIIDAKHRNCANISNPITADEVLELTSAAIVAADQGIGLVEKRLVSVAASAAEAAAKANRAAANAVTATERAIQQSYAAADTHIASVSTEFAVAAARAGLLLSIAGAVMDTGSAAKAFSEGDVKGGVSKGSSATLGLLSGVGGLAAASGSTSAIAVAGPAGVVASVAAAAGLVAIDQTITKPAERAERNSRDISCRQTIIAEINFRVQNPDCDNCDK